MAEINPFVFLVLGLIVTVSSSLNKDMRIFIIAGIGFICWGLYKLLLKKNQKDITRITNSDKNKTDNYQENVPKPHFQNTNRGNTSLGNNRFNARSQIPSGQPQYKKCPNCHSFFERNYRFCPYCGYGV